MWSGHAGQNGQKMAKNNQTIKGIFSAFIMIRKTLGGILTLFLIIAVMNWALGAYFCALIRNWHFETILGLALHQNPKAGWNFAWTLVWSSLTLFWKKKLVLRCGVALAAKRAKKKLKMYTSYIDFGVKFSAWWVIWHSICQKRCFPLFQPTVLWIIKRGGV